MEKWKIFIVLGIVLMSIIVLVFQFSSASEYLSEGFIGNIFGFLKSMSD